MLGVLEFQDYYETVLLKGTSASDIAWIGSAQYSLTLLPGLILGRLFDIGYFHGPYIAASINLIVCTFLTAECKTFWQLFLCQGFGVGMSCGFLFVPTSGIVAHWFKRRRATALGIVTMGSPLGGIIFPIAFRNLAIAVGFRWTMRIIAFFLILALTTANLTMRRRLPSKVVSGRLLDLKLFKSAAFSMYVAGGFIAFIGLYTVLTFINVSAPSQGVASGVSFYLVPIASAGLAIGRIVSGVLADRFGAVAVFPPVSLLTGIFSLVWPFLRGTGPLVTIALLYGVSSGMYAGLLLAVPVTAFGGSNDVGRRTGMCMTIFAFSAVAGPPLSGALTHATGKYVAAGICAGSSLIFGALLFLFSWLALLKGK
ncbi:MFS general substrate transporter [Gloeopeniophorella convolvens]|nr:MFS general substrate transporter [Gloeopeniophorella convolvens]